MTELLVNNVTHLSLVPSAPEAPVTLGQPLSGAIPLFAVAEMVASARPVEVLTSLADILANAGYHALIEVVEPGGVSYRVNHASPGQEAAAWGELTALLEAEDTLVCDGRQVGVAFHGPLATVPDARAAGTVTDWAFVAAMQVTRPPATAGDQPGWVGPHDVQVVRALVDHAVAVVTAERLRVELADQRRRVDNLELALTSNREIGVALGIIMATRRCSTDDAFALLRSVSQNSNRKIRDVAAQLAYTGELPAPPGARRPTSESQHAAPI